MTRKLKHELALVESSEPLATVEVDVDSIPAEYYGYDDIVEVASSAVATIYAYVGPSVNFGVQTYSVFLGVAGPQALLTKLLDAFKTVPGVNARFSDYISSANSIPQFHIQNGELWLPEDARTWVSVGEVAGETLQIADCIESDDEPEMDECEDEDEVIAVRQAAPTRYRAARSDAKVGSIRATIEQIFGLPEGSVALCGPDGRGLRADARIRTLRRRWE
jgi:hypothetical protein